jgi:acyl-CoA thioesterase-1
MGARRRFARHALLAIACATLLSSCSISPPTDSATSQKAWSVVALGDSVPRGSNCRCIPYPELSAASLTVPANRELTATNDAVGGFTSSDVLAQLNSDSDVISNVAKADVVEIEIGANDVAYSRSCGASAACYQPMIGPIERNLNDIVGRVRELTQGRQVLVILLDYWSVWLGGEYAEARGPAYVGAADEVTDQVNTVIKGTAAQTDSAYVDLRAAFKGPDYAYDETRYLASDGDHPNAAGHQQIAAALNDVLTDDLHF